MRINRAFTLLLLHLTLNSLHAAPPTHCKSEEFAVLDAWMGKVYHTEGGWRNARSGKVLSLCADKQAEPFSKLSYRYGIPGRAEFDVLASQKARFKIDTRHTGPSTGHNIVYFKRGAITYYVAIASGKGRGVSLHVFNGTGQVACHFSGNEAGEDYQLGPAEIDFAASKPLSSVVAKAPAHEDLWCPLP